MKWKVRGRPIALDRTCLMGILNLTPDSFSDGGRYAEPALALHRAETLAAEGAEILDLGAESTRPGAEPVSAEEELVRLLPVLEPLAKRSVALISIDTTKPEVAKACLERGAHIINDVSGLKDSGPEMAQLVRRFGAGLVLMHRRGDPKTMSGQSGYEDVIEEVLSELRASLRLAEAAGVDPESVAVDPGLGFAKDAEANFRILGALERFHELARPVLVGPSRKSFIGKITGRETGSREIGTAAACAVAVLKGAHILRVHEPAWMRDAVRVAEAIRSAS